MGPDTIARLDAEFAEFPILLADGLPSEVEVDQAERRVGVPFGEDYRRFLLRYGGAMVGPYPIFGLRPVEVMGDDLWSVVVVTEWYRAQEIPGTDRWVVMSNDHAGNPVGKDAAGAIWIYDHDFGGLAPLAESFEQYLRVRCLRLDPSG